MPASPLKMLRESLGFTPDEVAEETRWGLAYLRDLERSDDIDDADAMVLEALYGVDVVDVLERGKLAGNRSPVAALLKANTESLQASTRFALSEVVSVAREARMLEADLGRPSSWRRLNRTFRNSDDFGHPRSGVPANMSAQVRAHFNLGTGPIQSLQRQILEPLGILVFTVRVQADLHAFAMADKSIGPVVVLNQDSERIRSPYTRRFALAHEICHLFYDRHKMRGMDRLCRHNIEPPRRQETNYLHNADIIDREQLPEPLPPQVEQLWNSWEPLPLLPNRELSVIDTLRRGPLLERLRAAWGEELIGEGCLREALHLSAEDWDKVRSIVTAGAAGSAATWNTSAAALGLPGDTERSA